MDSKLFTYMDKDSLIGSLNAFYGCTHLETQVIDAEGTVVYGSGESAEFCKEFQKFLPEDDSCVKVHVNASKRAISLGETYIFSCHAGLTHIVYPLLYKDLFCGSVIVGPFLMEEPDSALILDIAKHYDIPTESLLKLSETSHSLELIPPETVTELSKLLFYLLSNIIADSRQQSIYNQGKLLQQSRINEAIQMYKSSGYKDDIGYPYEKEKELLVRVKSGDVEGAKETLNEILGALFLLDKQNPERIRIRLIELCSVLSRTAIDGGADMNKILEMNQALIDSFLGAYDLYDLCFKFQDNMEIFTESLYYGSCNNRDLIKKAAAYIAAHYSEPITLEEIAKVIHLSPAYLSSLFKQATGKSFKEYLTDIRIEEGKRLLENTDYPIIDVAVACGFNDQSYFTKVFKKKTGITPKHYR